MFAVIRSLKVLCTWAVEMDLISLQRLQGFKVWPAQLRNPESSWIKALSLKKYIYLNCPDLPLLFVSMMWSTVKKKTVKKSRWGHDQILRLPLVWESYGNGVTFWLFFFFFLPFLRISRLFVVYVDYSFFFKLFPYVWAVSVSWRHE